MTHLSLQVTQVDVINSMIHELTLRASDGSSLPSFSAGAHVRVQVNLPNGETDWRHYSLINFNTNLGSCENPDHYTIAVRREDDGRGGSRFMHSLKGGDTLSVEPPKNDFPLTDFSGRIVLIAGGIGVTPLISMASQRLAHGQKVSMIYAGRSREMMAYLPEVSALLGDSLRLHIDAETGGPLNVQALLDECGEQDQIYVCGPKVMLDAVLSEVNQRKWPKERIHFELFSAPVVEHGDHEFEVQLAQSAESYKVAANQTILNCLIEHGCDPLFDCKRGECGICAVTVIEGEVDHRDYVLTEAEKIEGKVIHICVSRAKGQRLVLDI